MNFSFSQRLVFITILLLFIFTIKSSYSQCNITIPNSLIPNPSFEDYSVCPNGPTQLNKATNWVVPSVGTSDYFNCSYPNLTGYSLPPPAPDGTGYAGYINKTGYKEYVASCLPNPMVTGTPYTIQFNLAAASADTTFGWFTGASSLTTNVAIFGSTSCANIPFSGTDCPTTATGWILLGTVTANTLNNAWTTHSITFIPPANITTLIFGPDCSSPPPGGVCSGICNQYYYIDNLILNTTVSFLNVTANAGADKITNCTTPSANLVGYGIGGTPGYTFSWSDSIGNPTPPNVTPIITSDYTLTITDQNGCTDTDLMTVYVNKDIPNADAGSGFTTNCNTPTATLNGAGENSYTWDNGAGTSPSPTVNPAVTTTYQLIVTDTINGCTDTDQVTITVDKNSPLADAGSDFTTTCITPSATLQGSGGGNYSWNNGGGTTATLIVDPAVTTTYTLTVTNPSNGCTSADSVLITVDKTVPSAIIDSDITLNCATTSDIFTASGGVTYSWTSPNGTSSASTFTVDDTNTPGNYEVIVTAANGCTDSEIALLTIDQVDPIAIAGPDLISNCYESNPTMDGSNSSGTGISYSWTGPNVTNGANSALATGNTAGIYTLTVTSSNFCTHSDQIEIVEDFIQPNSFAGSDLEINCNDLEVFLDGSGSSEGDSIIFLWSGPKDSFTNDTTSNTTSINLSGAYTLLVTNINNGCTAIDTINVYPTEGKELLIPNVFTPNDDGVNDLFYIKGRCIEDLNTNIRNRWGQLMFVSTGITSHWDGYTTSGETAPEGTYFYIIKVNFKDGHSKDYSGSFMLNR